MQDLEGKKTALDDDAEIYKIHGERAEDRSAGEHWKNLDAKGKWQYFRNYYFWKTFVGILILALLGYIVYNALKPKPEELAFVVILDCAMDTGIVDQQFEKLVEKSGYDTKKAEINSDKRLTSAKNNTTDVTTISAYIFAGAMDIMIGTEDALNHYAQEGILRDLSTILPKDILDGIPEEQRFIFHYVPEKDDGADAVERDIFIGLRMDSTELVKEAKYTTSDTGFILSLVVNGKEDRLEGIYKIIRALYDLPQVQ